MSLSRLHPTTISEGKIPASAWDSSDTVLGELYDQGLKTNN